MMNSNESFDKFRQELHTHLNNRADATMDLLDALSGNTEAKSPVELSLNPLFRRHYSALYRAVEGFTLSESEIWEVMSHYLPEPRSQGWWLLSSDVTPNPRPYAKRLSDRGFVYQPQVVTSNKPVTIGHQYSGVVLLPEKQGVLEPPWVIPLSVRRVATNQDKELVAAEQMAALLSDPSLPFGRDLCVEVVDSSYSKPEYLAAQRSHANLVTITRVRSNRTFYRPGQKSDRSGHPIWYGDHFVLGDPTTWGTPDEQEKEWTTTAKGRLVQVERTLWQNMLMRGKQKPTPLPMQLYPFSLVRIAVTTPTGEPVYRQPLWLIVMGEQRQRLTLAHIHHAYSQRFDHEHFLRFAKQRLLLTSFQTPDTPQEEHWLRLVHLAYFQLWLARPLAQAHLRPWERYLTNVRLRPLTPTLVQRSFAQIIRHLGTPATAPKPRGYSTGRRKGVRLTPRPRLSVVHKRPKRPG